MIGSYKTVIAASVFSVPAVPDSDAIQKTDSYKKLFREASGRLRAHLLARYQTNISAEFHASQHARRDEIVGFVANLTLYVEALKKSTVCLNECNIIFTVRIE